MKENEIAKIIIDLREDVGWSQSELARRAGVTSAAISMIEKGDRNPTLEMVIKLCKALKISISELLGEKPPVIYRDALRFYREFSYIEKLQEDDKQLIKEIADRLFR